jgi:hypothetical protein
MMLSFQTFSLLTIQDFLRHFLEDRLNNKSLKFWREYLILTNQIFPTLRGVGVEEKCQRLNSIFGFASFFIIFPKQT